MIGANEVGTGIGNDFGEDVDESGGLIGTKVGRLRCEAFRTNLKAVSSGLGTRKFPPVGPVVHPTEAWPMLPAGANCGGRWWNVGRGR